jgi:hypothetical protein
MALEKVPSSALKMIEQSADFVQFPNDKMPVYFIL